MYGTQLKGCDGSAQLRARVMDRANRSEWSRGCAQVVCDGEDEEDEGGVRHQRVEARRPCVHRAASLARLTRFVNTRSFPVSRPAGDAAGPAARAGDRPHRRRSLTQAQGYRVALLNVLSQSSLQRMKRLSRRGRRGDRTAPVATPLCSLSWLRPVRSTSVLQQHRPEHPVRVRERCGPPHEPSVFLSLTVRRSRGSWRTR